MFAVNLGDVFSMEKPELPLVKIAVLFSSNAEKLRKAVWQL